MSILKLETPQKSQQAVDALYQVLENMHIMGLDPMKIEMIAQAVVAGLATPTKIELGLARGKKNYDKRQEILLRQ